jgi:NAD(P)-dependent dehydrogenase (short-subunit alcohol dehydrogenase family)
MNSINGATEIPPPHRSHTPSGGSSARSLRPPEPMDMVGRVAVVTGANTGLGFATAQRLIARGATVVLSCRTQAKCQAAAARLGGAPSATCGPPLELQDLASVRRFATFFRARDEPVHILINNAGGMVSTHSAVSLAAADGTVADVEETFAANCVGPAALTLEMLPVLERSAQPGRTSRVVTVASKLEHNADLAAYLNDVSGRSNAGLAAKGQDGAAAGEYNTWTAYANSKQGNLHTTAALAAEGLVPHVTHSAVTPGMVNTELGRAFAWFSVTAPIRWLLLPSAHGGADATIYAATSVDIEGKTGLYFGKV